MNREQQIKSDTDFLQSIAKSYVSHIRQTPEVQNLPELLTDDFLQSLGFVHAGSKENAPDGAKWMYIGDSHSLFITSNLKFFKRDNFSNVFEPVFVCNFDILQCQMRECWQYEKYAQQIECEYD